MAARLKAAIVVSALLRQVDLAGGAGAVLFRGDPDAGSLLFLLADRGVVRAVRERGLLPDGRSGWIATGPADPSDVQALHDYLEKRRRFDPDLWVVELDGLTAEAFESLAGDA